MMLHGSETVSLSNRQKAELEVEEVKMMRIRTEQISGTVKVEQLDQQVLNLKRHFLNRN